MPLENVNSCKTFVLYRQKKWHSRQIILFLSLSFSEYLFLEEKLPFDWKYQRKRSNVSSPYVLCTLKNY